MTYIEALELESGEKVKIKGTEELHKVECIRGTTRTIFVLLDSGMEYRHDLLERERYEQSY